MNAIVKTLAAVAVTYTALDIAAVVHFAKKNPDAKIEDLGEVAYPSIKTTVISAMNKLSNK